MKRNLRVLHVEDSARDVAVQTIHLKRAGYEPEGHRAETAGAMKEALENHAWDVILCDYAMPRFDALGALAVVRESGLDLPFIVISGTIGENVAVEAMRAGAHDYLMKDNLTRLVPAIERELVEAANRRARRQAEAALRASEVELRALFAAMTDAIFVLDREGRHVRVAPSSRRLYKPAVERIGKTLHEVYPPETASFFLAQLNLAFESGQVLQVEYTLPIQGEEKWFEGTVSPISAESVLWVARDITERKQSENEKARLSAAIENQRQRLDNIVSSVPGIVWEAWSEPDGEIQRPDFVSDYIETMLGYSVEEWLSTPNFWLQIVHPEDRERTKRIAAENFALATNKTTIDFRWLAKDGRVLWVEYISTVVTNGEGRPIGTRGVAIDVSERKRAEAALRDSEERYRDLVENAHDIIYSHKLDGTYTSVNEVGELITGYSRDESLQLNFSQIIAPESLATARKMLGRKLAGERARAYELNLIAKDGRRIAVEVNSKLVYQDGVPVAVQGIARDVTKRRHLEDQLRQSQKMEAIGQLAGGVAHDFNNLLTAINGYGALALRRVDGNDLITGYLEEIQKAGDRAANLTRQLLAFGRKQMLQPIALNLNDIVSDMNKMLRRLIGEDIRLTAKLDPGLRTIKADSGQIEQVLVNLVVNARDAMPTGGDLLIETTNVTCCSEYPSPQVGVDPGSYVMLAVSDTGTGMDEQTKARVFEPFFTTKEKGKGTGLGLSTVYGIVKQSGGHVWLYSEPGRGTAFKVYFPEFQKVDEPTVSPSAKIPPPTGSETILLVEDEDIVRNLTTKILEQAGYNVLPAGGAEEALRLCYEYANQIHLLLTDVIMPATSGKEIADRLKIVRPETRVLFMSGHTDETIVHHGVLDSKVEFIQKPFSPSALASKVRQVLDSVLT